MLPLPGFGVAAVFHALAHTLIHIVDPGTLHNIRADIPQVCCWTGLIAFPIFVRKPG